MKNDAIVITGVGALSPNGGDRESYFAATAEGRSGIRSITHFDSEALPCRIAGEVDFDPTQWVDPKNIRHVSRVVPMAIAASAEALRDAKLDPLAMDLEGRQSFGVMLGSGGGAVEFSDGAAMRSLNRCTSTSTTSRLKRTVTPSSSSTSGGRNRSA